VRRWIQQKGVQILEGDAYGPLDEDSLAKPAAVLAGRVVKIGKRQYFKFS